MNKKIYFIVFLGLMLLSVVIIAESTLSLHFYYKHHTFSRAKAILQRKIVSPDLPVGYDKDRALENILVIHPFFGYVYNSKLPYVNNFGFQSKYNISLSDSGYSLEFGQRKDLLIVGIFGGSFARYVGRYSDYLEEKLKTLFPEKTPVVINFGVAGHALPQSAFIFIYFKELCDIIVFIDGLNEIWNPIENNEAGYPPEYAKAVHFNYKLSLNEMSPEKFILTQHVIKMKKKLEWIRRISLLPIIRQSLVTHYIWLASEKIISYQIALVSLKIEKIYMNNGLRFFDVENELILNHAVKQWSYYHQLVHNMASSDNILDIHLLQPNPFVENSKSLTNEEIDLINQSMDLGPFVTAGYPKLMLAVQSLKKSGVLTEDITFIFKNIKESVWRDPCHCNEKGNKIIADKIFDLIKKNYH